MVFERLGGAWESGHDDVESQLPMRSRKHKVSVYDGPAYRIIEWEAVGVVLSVVMLDV